MNEKIVIPKFCFCSVLNEDVEVVSVGHFPDTVLVKLMNGRTVEVYLSNLRQYN